MSATDDLVAAIWRPTKSISLDYWQRSVVMRAATRAVSQGPREYQAPDGSQRWQTVHPRHFVNDVREEVADAWAYVAMMVERDHFAEESAQRILFLLAHVLELVDAEERACMAHTVDPDAVA